MLRARCRCPDCGQEIEVLSGEQTSSDCDYYEPVLCPKCQQLHSVNLANGEVVAEDELGDPW